jgi:hypothetical protein
MKQLLLLSLSITVCLSTADGQTSVIVPSGRWEVQTTSGDQPAQVSTGIPVTFNGTFECDGGACGSPQNFTSDTSICDHIGFSNIGNGMVINGLNVAFQFEVSGGSGGVFLYSFLGSFNETDRRTPPLETIETISGTYGSTPGGCNNGIPSDQGTFTAYWYPPITGTYFGELAPEGMGGTEIGLEVSLNQQATGELAGTITTGQIARNIRTGAATFVPKQSPCFTSTNLTVTQGQGSNSSDASGGQLKIFALDSDGNALTLLGIATSAGSNAAYSVDYKIGGGTCSGQFGTNAHFISVASQAPLDPVLPPRIVDHHAPDENSMIWIKKSWFRGISPFPESGIKANLLSHNNGASSHISIRNEGGVCEELLKFGKAFEVIMAHQIFVKSTSGRRFAAAEVDFDRRPSLIGDIADFWPC